MIYSKFGTQLTLISKQQQQGSGRLSIQATAGGTADVREYHISDMTADGGLAEIDEALEKLPWKVIEKRTRRVR